MTIRSRFCCAEALKGINNDSKSAAQSTIDLERLMGHDV
jgi:hypothetical protein